MGGFPTYNPSSPPTTETLVWSPRHGASAEVPSTAPTATIAAMVTSPTVRLCFRRGHQNAPQAASHASTASSSVESLVGRSPTRHQTELTFSHRWSCAVTHAPQDTYAVIAAPASAGSTQTNIRFT